MKKNKKTFYFYIRSIMEILPKRRKKQFPVLLFGMVLVALFETTALGIISLFATSIAAPENVLKSTKFIKAVSILGISKTITPELLIITLSIAVVFLIIIKNSIQGFVRYWVARYASVIQGHLGQMILDRYLRVDYEWHLKENAHNLLILLSWRGQIGGFVSSLLSIVSNLIMVVIMLAGIISFQPVMMLFVIGILGLTSFFIYSKMKGLIDDNTKIVLKYNRGSNLDAAKTILGMKDVRIFGLEDKFLNDYSNQLFKLAKYRATQGILKSIPTWIMEVLGFAILSAGIILMLYVLKLSRLEIFGTISLLAVTAWRVLPAINRILGGISSLRVNIPYIDNVYEMLDSIDSYMFKEKNNYKSDESNILSFNELIEFKGLKFNYSSGDRTILNNINCKIKKGLSIGIVGHSGAGKSTFVDLFIGLLRPTSGNILIDGIDLTDNLTREWRSKIGYVPQFPYIYDCSLAENIAFGESVEDIDEGKVFEACKKASIDFLDDLEDGIYTRIGDRGMMISGGQKQRVAIARALYKDPEVLVFDEATSSLDTKSEKEIQKTIDSFKGKHTMIVVAHRLSTVENCDQLIWLEKGKIIKIDKPEKILQEYIEYQNSSIE